jgi:hypothetical protein
MPGTVAQTCNPIYLESEDVEDRGLRPAWTKNLIDPRTNQYRLGVVMPACHLSCIGSINRCIPVWPGHKCENLS